LHLSHDALHLEVCSLQRNLQHASSLMDLCNQKLIRLEDKVGGTFILESYAILSEDLNIKKIMNFQLRGWSERLRRLLEDGMQQSISLGNSQRKLTGMLSE
jgi:E3 ubiquitin-protein ligase BRE1